MITGTVQTVSADRLIDQKTGQPYFNVEVSVDRSALKDFPQVRIIPGEPVEVSLDTGQRTMLSYFTEPIGDVLRRGMREK
jgi:multidrug efflux pump subunit AcrA (membrane-fusion protein)